MNGMTVKNDILIYIDIVKSRKSEKWIEVINYLASPSTALHCQPFRLILFVLGLFTVITEAKE